MTGRIESSSLDKNVFKLSQPDDISLITSCKFVLQTVSKDLRWGKNYHRDLCSQHLCNWTQSQVSHIILAVLCLIFTGNEAGVCCWSLRVKSFFSELNCTFGAFLFLSFIQTHQSDLWQRLTSGSPLHPSLTPPSFSLLAHQSLRPASRSSKLDWH